VKSDHHLKKHQPGRLKGGYKEEKRSADGVCHDFNKTGHCPRGASCRFQHIIVQATPALKCDEESIGRHCEVVGAHGQGIQAISMSEQGIYTASLDKSLNRWKPVPKPDGRMELQNDLKIPLPESCYALLFKDGWLLCGMWDGSIIAYSQDGSNHTLQGHSRKVTALLVHAGVLISGSADKDVRLWQTTPGSNAFSCTHTISESMPGPINRLYVLGEHLFVGGVSGLAMCNLQNLTVTKILPPTKPVADFLEFQGHIIVAYTDGSLRVFDPEGTFKSGVKPLPAGPIVSLGGLDSGPRVLVGHAKGQVSTITLPNFEFKTQFQALLGSRVEAIRCVGHDGLFLLGFSNGTLQLWQRVGT